MPRYIDADALKDELELADFETDSRMFGGQTVLFEDSVFKIVDSAPTITPDEVRGVGEWKTAMLDHESFGVRPKVLYCSECHQCIAYPTRYCPSCGARMTRAEAEKAMEGADTDASA